MRPAKLIVGSEMGVGNGHIASLCVIADRYVEQGHSCLFAVPNRQGIYRLRPQWLAMANVQVIDCPTWQPRSLEEVRQRPTTSFADILEMSGFTDAETVMERARWWSQLIDRIQPDLVVTEFAPGCTLAARGRVPVVAIGTGYSILPDVSPMPCMAFWEPNVPDRCKQIESIILSVMNSCRDQLGLPCLPRVSAVFRGDRVFPCTFRCFDMYRAVRDEKIYTPIQLEVSAEDKRTEHGVHSKERRGFVYFSIDHPIFRKTLIMLLAQSQYACAVYAPEYRDLFRGQSKMGCHEILGAPLDMKRLGEFAFCVHPGGMGVSTAAAMLRVPQLLVPVSLESLSTAYALYQQAAAVFLMPDRVEALTHPNEIVAIVGESLRMPLRLDQEFSLAATASNETKNAIQQAMDEYLGRHH